MKPWAEPSSSSAGAARALTSGALASLFRKQMFRQKLRALQVRSKGQPNLVDRDRCRLGPDPAAGRCPPKSKAVCTLHGCGVSEGQGRRSRQWRPCLLSTMGAQGFWSTLQPSTRSRACAPLKNSRMWRACGPRSGCDGLADPHRLTPWTTTWTLTKSPPAAISSSFAAVWHALSVVGAMA